MSGADNSPPSCTEVKKEWNYTSTPQYVFMEWCLIKQWQALLNTVTKFRVP
jgi:hypothetical protein